MGTAMLYRNRFVYRPHFRRMHGLKAVQPAFGMNVGQALGVPSGDRLCITRSELEAKQEKTNRELPVFVGAMMLLGLVAGGVWGGVEHSPGMGNKPESITPSIIKGAAVGVTVSGIGAVLYSLLTIYTSKQVVAISDLRPM